MFQFNQINKMEKKLFLKIQNQNVKTNWQYTHT